MQGFAGKLQQRRTIALSIALRVRQYQDRIGLFIERPWPNLNSLRRACKAAAIRQGKCPAEMEKTGNRDKMRFPAEVAAKARCEARRREWVYFIQGFQTASLVVSQTLAASFGNMRATSTSFAISAIWAFENEILVSIPNAPGHFFCMPDQAAFLR